MSGGRLNREDCMKKIVGVLLAAGALFPFAAIAADAPGPGWAFMTPDPDAPAPPPAGGGGGGKTTACTSCHGANLQGVMDVPAIAGRSPVYIARQIYSFKNSVRKGTNADIMKGVVDKLSDDDVIAISSYVASQSPS